MDSFSCFPSKTVSSFKDEDSFLHIQGWSQLLPNILNKQTRNQGFSLGLTVFLWKLYGTLIYALVLELRASLVAQMVKNTPAMQNTWVRSLGWEDPLEEDMATHSSIRAWRNPMDRWAWQATVHGVAKSRTQLSDSAHHTPGIECLLMWNIVNLLYFSYILTVFPALYIYLCACLIPFSDYNLSRVEISKPYNWTCWYRYLRDGHKEGNTCIFSIQPTSFDTSMWRRQ